MLVGPDGPRGGPGRPRRPSARNLQRAVERAAHNCWPLGTRPAPRSTTRNGADVFLAPPLPRAARRSRVKPPRVRRRGCPHGALHRHQAAQDADGAAARQLPDVPGRAPEPLRAARGAAPRRLEQPRGEPGARAAHRDAADVQPRRATPQKPAAAAPSKSAARRPASFDACALTPAAASPGVLRGGSPAEASIESYVPAFDAFGVPMQQSFAGGLPATPSPVRAPALALPSVTRAAALLPSPKVMRADAAPRPSPKVGDPPPPKVPPSKKSGGASSLFARARPGPGAAAAAAGQAEDGARRRRALRGRRRAVEDARRRVRAAALHEVRARRRALPGLPVAADRRVPALPELPPRSSAIAGGGRGRRRPRGPPLPVRVARRRRAPRPRLRPRVGRASLV